MIKLQDKDDFEVNISVVGTQATGRKFIFLMPFAGWLKAVYLKLGTKGITGTQTVDINIGGSSIFASGGITFTAVADVNAYAALTADPTSFAKGDVVSLDVDAIHSGTAAEDMSAILVFTRTKPAGMIKGAVEVSVGKGF
jgi:hypothetical protein